MALNDFKKTYIMRYEDILSKVMVGLKIANTRFESDMNFGDTVTRFTLNLSAVRVRTFTNLTNQTIDPLTDSTENMTVNVQVGAVFPIARLEKIQAGPLDPAMVAGKEIAMKVANFLDASILYETRNSWAAFDTGNLTTATANGTPITLSSTTVPQLVAQTYAKLFSNNVAMTNTCWVLDPFSVSQIAQFPIGKDLTAQNTVFLNGFTGSLFGSEVYTSNNLTSESKLTMATTPNDADTVTIGGVVFTFKTTLGSTAGNVLIGGSADVARANLVALINAPATTTANGVALSAADQITLQDTLGIGTASGHAIAAVNDNTADTAVVYGVGSSRFAVSASLQSTDAWTYQFVHCYYGMKGAIDVAIQDQPTVEMRDEPQQLTTNIFNNVVAAIKTFNDGTQKFLDVKIKNA